MQQPVTDKEREQLLIKIQFLLDNGLIDVAKSTLNELKLSKQYKIVNGRLTAENDQTEPWLTQFITSDPSMIKVKEMVRKLAKIQDEVLISGPTGTGKEILAHALHGTREGDFCALNCAGLPEHLIESELFGHIRGAFTGATSDKIGLTVASKMGTLFMDEVGELPMLAQAKLLRVLADKKVRPVGSNEHKDISCRFVFATNKDLKDMIKTGHFRADLFARIATFELETLALDKRGTGEVNIILKHLGASDELITNSSMINLEFNVRSLQMAVKRYNVLGSL